MQLFCSLIPTNMFAISSFACGFLYRSMKQRPRFGEWNSVTFQSASHARPVNTAYVSVSTIDEKGNELFRKPEGVNEPNKKYSAHTVWVKKQFGTWRSHL